jgi:hypothetical protein
VVGTASVEAFLAELEFMAAEFEWVCGQSLVRTYEAPVRKTPLGYRRTFCTVWWRAGADSGSGIIRVPAGTLDGDPGIRPQRQRHIFVDFKALGSRSPTPLANLARNQNPVSREETPTGGERYQALDLFH